MQLYAKLPQGIGQIDDRTLVHAGDPFDAKGQFCDKGHSYLSAIFVADEAERKVAEESKQNVVELFPDEKVVTPILDASTFYPIKGDESGHQDYYKNNPIRYKSYRWGCGRDKRLKQIWDDKDISIL